ncbi:zinc-binding dehydrogenase [Streptomyces pluripotens]|uniref:zinc-binding dehydrogenase n=1 Tax=Streptomyces pluripotens TaxID=1355015 RepID=UPI002D219A2D|nr:zinc-binding dehydrogenase [Streptomyces pluripotens]
MTPALWTGEELQPPLAKPSCPLVADGHIRPVLDTSWFFGTADQVVERLRSHRSEGKIVLTVP